MDDPILNDDIQDTSAFDLTEEEKYAERSIIKVIGVGGGGGNAVNYMYKQNIPLIKYVVLNTDKQALKQMKVPDKVLIGYDVTHGLGAGDNPDIGRQCAESSEEQIKALFDDETEMVFVTAGMGGGTGTGAAPVVARLAKESGKLTIGIVSVPFLFEAELKILKALEGAREMQKYVDSLLIINNESLIDIYEDLSIFNCFEKADDTLTNAARSISEIISEDCYINVDFQDVKTTLRDSGTAIISTALGEGEHRVTDAIQNALHSPLLKKHDIKTSKRLLIKFSCSKDSSNPLTAKEMREIRDFTSKLSSTIGVKWGVADDPTLGDKIKVTILASGFVVTLGDNEDNDNEDGPIQFNPDQNETVNIPTDSERQKKKKEQAKSIEEIYGKDVTKGMAIERLKMRCFVLKPEEFDNDEVIAHLERKPTKDRDSRTNDEIHKLHNTVQQPVVHRQGDSGEGSDTIMF